MKKDFNWLAFDNKSFDSKQTLRFIQLLGSLVSL